MTSRPALSASMIVDEAIDLIRHEGVRGLSMRALATRMGVTAPAFYAHFRGRDELLRACAQVGYDRLAEAFEREAPASAIEMVRASSRSYVRYAMEEPALFSLMFMYRPGAIEIDAEVSADIEHVGASVMFDTMIANLHVAITDGDLRPGDPLDYGMALWAAVHGIATVATLAPGLDVDKLLGSVVDGMLEGWHP